MVDILSQIKPKIASIINEDSYKTWIEPLQFLDYRDGKVSIVVPNAFFRDWVVENFEQILLTLIKDTTKDDVRIEYVLKREE